MNTIKSIVCILSVLSFTMLCGCGEGKGPAWFKFGKPGPAQEPEPGEIEGTVLASVNGRIIILEDFKARIEAINSEIQTSKDIPDSVRSNYLIETFEDKKEQLEEMVQTEILIAEAIERRLDKDKDMVKAIKALKEQMLLAKLIESERDKITVTVEEIENFYNLNKDAFTIPEERKVSTIVVPTEAKAKEVLITLLQGGDFSALARVNSSDKSASNGGNIGFIVKKLPFPQPEKKTMFEKFEERAFTLELNKSSTIFKGPDGYYIIKVTEIKGTRQRLLSEVYSDLDQGLTMRKREEALKTLIGNLRKTANIIIHENLLRD